jgi:hypothetical protein
MSRFDLQFGNTAVHALDYQDVTAAANGDAIDLKDRRGALFVFSSHTLGTGTFTFKIQESDASGSGYADVDASYLSGANAVAFADTEDNSVKSIGYQGLKRYVRCVCTPSGESGTNFLSAECVVAENYAS